MKSAAPFRLLLTALVAALWLVAAVRPALAGSGCAKAHPCSCCHQDGRCGQTGCAVAPQASGPAAGAIADVSVGWDAAPALAALPELAALLTVPAAQPLPAIRRGEAPPGRWSFAVQVLQRSLRALAPPAAA